VEVLKPASMRGFILWMLSSNGSTCHTAPSLGILVPNSLQVYRHFSFSQDSAFDISCRGGVKTHKMASNFLQPNRNPRHSFCLLLNPLMPLLVVFPGPLQICLSRSAVMAWESWLVSGSGQFLPGLTTTLGPFLRPSTSPQTVPSELWSSPRSLC
jgi:hypothetical protein